MVTNSEANVCDDVDDDSDEYDDDDAEADEYVVMSGHPAAAMKTPATMATQGTCKQTKLDQ